MLCMTKEGRRRLKVNLEEGTTNELSIHEEDKGPLVRVGTKSLVIGSDISMQKSGVACVAMDDNCVLVSGGSAEGGRQCWFFYMDTKKTKLAPAMNCARSRHALVRYHGNIIALGGMPRDAGQVRGFFFLNKRHNDLFILVKHLIEFNIKKKMINFMFLLQAKVCEVLVPGSKIWDAWSFPPLPRARPIASAASVGNYIYVAGDTTAVLIYDGGCWLKLTAALQFPDYVIPGYRVCAKGETLVFINGTEFILYDIKMKTWKVVNLINAVQEIEDVV